MKESEDASAPCFHLFLRRINSIFSRNRHRQQKLSVYNCMNYYSFSGSNLLRLFFCLLENEYATCWLDSLSHLLFSPLDSHFLTFVSCKKKCYLKKMMWVQCAMCMVSYVFGIVPFFFKRMKRRFKCLMFYLFFLRRINSIVSRNRRRQQNLSVCNCMNYRSFFPSMQLAVPLSWPTTLYKCLL